MLPLRQARAISVHSAARGIDEGLNAAIPSSEHEVHRARDINRMSGERIIDRARNRAHGGLVKNVIDARAALPACREVTDVAILKGEAGPLLSGDATSHFLEVL